MRSRVPVPKRITQTEPPPAAAAHGCAEAATGIVATVVAGVPAAAAAVAASATTEMRMLGRIVRDRSICSGLGLVVVQRVERFSEGLVEPLERVAHRGRIRERVGELR